MSGPLARQVVGAVVIILLARSAPALAGQETARDETVAPFLVHLEEVFKRGDPAEYFALLHTTAPTEHARVFLATEMDEGATRVVIQERDRRGFVNFEPGTVGFRII